MTSIDKDGHQRQRESERAWLGKPLTTGVAIALLATTSSREERLADEGTG